MCVLYACETDVPDLKVLEDNEAMNDDGGGCAWIDDRGRVCWRKGFQTASDLWRFIKDKPLPSLIHQRMRSAGPVCPELTHPFPVTKDVSLALSGHAKAVLAHNGTVSYEVDMSHAAKTGIHIPPGPWSDTRWMTYVYAHTGDKGLRAYTGGQKIAILTKDGISIINPELWRYNPKKTGGYWQSADYSAWADQFTIKDLPRPTSCGTDDGPQVRTTRTGQRRLRFKVVK
jgi:hypothetical protein